MITQQQSGSRSTNACERCRRRKVKCSGERPCKGCRRHRVDCVFAAHGRSRLTEEQVQALLTKIANYEETLKKLDPSGTAGNAPEQRADAVTPLQRAYTGPATALGLPSSSSPATADPLTVSSDGTERPTGPAYESRVRNLLDRSQVQREIYPLTSDVTDHEDRPMMSEPARPSLELSLGDWLETAPQCTIPPESESRRLLDLFLTYLGVNQQFFDPRAFIDALSTLYQSQVARQKTMATSWYVEYLLVMAMANLMDFNTRSSDVHHGFDFFGEAMRRLPPMHRFTGNDVMVIEILMLVALYLQWRNRKHDAYLYIGFAMRHAISIGCAAPDQTQACLPSERAHRVRVWWTAFMLDRRLSADLGLPSASDDRQITVQLPIETPGFPSPEALIINIKIARTTSHIMTSLYGNAVVGREQLVQNIQDVLHTLYGIGQSIPKEYNIDLTKSFPAVTRTGSSLYLMLFQAIILCARPMLLQRVRDKASNASNGASLEPATDLMARLSTTCKQSAINSIRILYGLRTKRQIARFGFFDMDATFSAALTLVMTGFAEGIEFSNMMPELHQAVDILQYLAEAGNKAAEQRLADVHQFSLHVWDESPVAARSKANESTTPGNRLPRNIDRETQEKGDRPSQQDQDLNLTPLVPDQTVIDDTLEQREQSVFGSGIDFQNAFNFDMGLQTDVDGIFSCFNDPSLPLTGVDELDWAEIGRVFSVSGNQQGDSSFDATGV